MIAREEMVRYGTEMRWKGGGMLFYVACLVNDLLMMVSVWHSFVCEYYIVIGKIENFWNDQSESVNRLVVETDKKPLRSLWSVSRQIYMPHSCMCYDWYTDKHMVIHITPNVCPLQAAHSVEHRFNYRANASRNYVFWSAENHEFWGQEHDKVKLDAQQRRRRRRCCQFFKVIEHEYHSKTPLESRRCWLINAKIRQFES